MSIDPKKFGLSDSLVNAVNEALKGNQTKLDKNHNGKLDAQDFKMLRKEDQKQQDAVDEQSPGEYEKANFKHSMLGTDKRMKNEVADGNKANFKANMKEEAEQIDELSPGTLSSYKTKAAGSETSLTNKSSTLSVPPKDRNAAAVKANQRRMGMKLATKKLGEESVDEAATKLVAKPQYDKARPAFSGTNVAADMADRKTEVQRKIAAKQASFQQAKANKRISGTTMKEAKCSCGEEKGSKMTCEVHGDNKGLKGGKEPIVMNPPLKEASNLPKAVVSKGHEIAKSLIKHRSKVKEPYAVGMATAKKSAGIKEDAEQVDELSKGTLKSYKNAAKWDIGGIKSNAPSNYEFDRDAMLKRRQAGMKMANKKLNKKD
jgi:hypothetical protein